MCLEACSKIVMRPLPKNFFLLLILPLMISCSRSDSELDFPKVGVPLPDAVLEIYYPLNGATLVANEPFSLRYEVVRGRNGAYVKVQVNDELPEIIYKTHGGHYMEKLPSGSYAISVTEYTESDIPTGAMAIIHITTK